jgi:putative oxidoreductase
MRSIAAEFIFRICLSLIFIVAGFKHLMATEAVAGRLAQTYTGGQLEGLVPLGMPIIASGVVLFVAGVMLLAGFRTRLSSIVLIAVLIPITLSVQLEPGQSGPLFKNIAIFGGLLHFAVEPVRSWGFDHRLRRGAGAGAR